MTKKLEFKVNVMRKFMFQDEFLRHEFDRMQGAESHRLEVLFNTYVLEDSAMERRYMNIDEEEVS